MFCVVETFAIIEAKVVLAEGLAGWEFLPWWPTLFPGGVRLEVEERLVEAVSGMACWRACPRDRILPPASFPEGNLASEESDFEGDPPRTFSVADARIPFPAAVLVDSPARGEVALGEARWWVPAAARPEPSLYVAFLPSNAAASASSRHHRLQGSQALSQARERRGGGRCEGCRQTHLARARPH